MWVRAEPPPPRPASARSISGQFVVRDARSTAGPAQTLAATNKDLIFLDPALVTVSCERIKQLLYHDLDAPAAWRGRVFVTVCSAADAGQPATIVSGKLSDGWQYRLELPEVMERIRFVRAIVRVLLLEMANRTADDRSAEVPAWLSEGFAQQLFASHEMEIILPPPRAGPNGLNLVSYNVSGRRADPLEPAHRKFQSQPPLSFYQLSWPADEQWSGESGEIYRCSAQLFLNELLWLNDGKACLRAMLAELPRRLNWQLAFLDSFHSHFQRTLDVEKWWALQSLHFAGRDVLAQTWPFEESRQKLDQALCPEVELHTGAGETPIYTSVKLQTIIRDWDSARQTQTIQSMLRQLDLLRSRVTPEFLVLIDAYRPVLEDYVRRPDKPGLFSFMGGRSPRGRVAEETIRKLDDLDARRALAQPAQKPIAARN